MTKTKYRSRPVWHETGASYADAGRARPICVAESASALLLKLKGTRTVLSLPYTTAYERAAVLVADQTASRRRRSGRSVRRGQLV